MKHRNKVILGSFVAIIVFAGLGFFALTAKTNTSDANNNNTTNTHPASSTQTPTPNNTIGSNNNNTSATSNLATGLNPLDAAAIAGALVAARQVPPASNKSGLATFLASLKVAKSGKVNTLDLGVIHNQLVDYSVDPIKGSGAPICFVVQPPLVAKATPYQGQWALYLDPGSSKSKSVLIVEKGVSTCAQALIAANKANSASRALLTANSKTLVKSSILSLPSTALTRDGLYILDEARGLLTPAASPSPTK